MGVKSIITSGSKSTGNIWAADSKDQYVNTLNPVPEIDTGNKNTFSTNNDEASAYIKEVEDIMKERENEREREKEVIPKIPPSYIRKLKDEWNKTEFKRPNTILILYQDKFYGVVEEDIPISILIDINDQLWAGVLDKENQSLTLPPVPYLKKILTDKEKWAQNNLMRRIW